MKKKEKEEKMVVLKSFVTPAQKVRVIKMAEVRHITQSEIIRALIGYE